MLTESPRHDSGSLGCDLNRYCPRVENPRECFVAFGPVLPTECLNGNSRHDTRVVKGSRGIALMAYRQGVAFNANR
jgi:hypothetical protein